MPQYMDDGVIFNFNASTNDWPELSCSQANLLTLNNSDLQLDAAKSLQFQGSGQLSFQSDGQISAQGALTVRTGATLTERLRITADGNVGIGKAPGTGYKLDVAGALNATGILVNDVALKPLMIQSGAALGGELQGVAQRAVPITFPTSFSVPPTIVVGTHFLDVDHTSNTRYFIEADNVTAQGFTLKFETWADTHIYQIMASWIAYGAP